ncbi:MAG: hypothetical protein FJZ87_02970 [Chloroflexi bacterium]|nr:hypothetical protein [Chloroflexota bacterium]
MTTDPAQLAERGKRAFEEQEFEKAAMLFQQAADGFTLGRNGLLAAEMRNSLSVALLKMNRPQEALDAALGTDSIFAGAADLGRQAMALGNQAAALESLHRLDEALGKYEQSAKLFGRTGDGEMRSLVMKSAAAIQLKTGRVSESAFKMMGALDATDKPTWLERILKFLLRFIK